MTPETTLRYDAPATAWTDALPLGNGRLGAMVFGGVAVERLQLNDDTCWSGAPRSGSAPDGPAALAAARSALERDDVREAERQVQRLQGGFVQSYQPLVDLWLEQPAPPSSTGTPGGSGSTRPSRGSRGRPGPRRRSSAGRRRSLVVHRTWSGGPAELDVRVTSEHPLDEPRRRRHPVVDHPAPAVRRPARLRRRGRAWSATAAPGASITAAVAVEVVTDGVVVAGPDGLRLRGATWATLVVATATDYVDTDHPAARGRGAAARAGAVHGRGRRGPRGSRPCAPSTSPTTRGSSTGCPRPRPTSASRRPTDERLRGTRPATRSRPRRARVPLRPVPDDRRVTPGHAAADAAGDLERRRAAAVVEQLHAQHQHRDELLAGAEHQPRRVRRAAAALGRRARRGGYAHGDRALRAARLDRPPQLRRVGVHGARSATAPATRPGRSGRSAASGSRGTWSTTTTSPGTRSRQAVLHGAARFVLDWLVELPDGTLGTRPSTSPENTFVAPDGRPAAVTTSTTADLAMARDLLENVVRLGGPPDLVAEASAALDRLPAGAAWPPDGRLAEWRDDVADAEPEHRHQSHLFRVHPGTVDRPRPGTGPRPGRAGHPRRPRAGVDRLVPGVAAQPARPAARRGGRRGDGRRVPAPGRPGSTRRAPVASTRTCSAPTRRSRSTATSASRPASPSSCSSRTARSDGLREVHLLPTLPASLAVRVGARSARPRRGDRRPHVGRARARRRAARGGPGRLGPGPPRRRTDRVDLRAGRGLVRSRRDGRRHRRTGGHRHRLPQEPVVLDRLAPGPSPTCARETFMPSMLPSVDVTAAPAHGSSVRLTGWTSTQSSPLARSSAPCRSVSAICGRSSSAKTSRVTSGQADARRPGAVGRLHHDAPHPVATHRGQHGARAARADVERRARRSAQAHADRALADAERDDDGVLPLRRACPTRAASVASPSTPRTPGERRRVPRQRGDVVPTGRPARRRRRGRSHPSPRRREPS